MNKEAQCFQYSYKGFGISKKYFTVSGCTLVMAVGATTCFEWKL